MANRKLHSGGFSPAAAVCLLAVVVWVTFCLAASPSLGQYGPAFPSSNYAPPAAGSTNMPAASAGMAPGTAPAQPPAALPAEVLVTEVRIVGNKSLPVEEITPHLRTRAGRPFNLEIIEEDAHRLHQTGKFIDVRTFWQQAPGGRIVIYEVLERPILTEVKFVGNEEIGKKKLEKETGLKAGDPLNNFAVEEARRKLETFYKSKGFSKARVTLIEGDKSTDRRAIFYINEGVKQKVQIVEFIGNTIASDERLQTQIKTKNPVLYMFKGELDRKELEEDVHRLTDYYRALGFFQAKIGYEIGPFNLSEHYDYRGLGSRVGRELNQLDSAQWVVVTFVINEGPRFKIRNISVEGNTKYNSEELLSDMKLESGEFFDRGKMLADRNALSEKYGSVGYVFCDVKAEPRLLEQPATLDLTYKIKENDRYRVGNVNVVIKGEYPHTKITTVMNRLSLRPGDIVDIREIRASERRLKYSQLFEINPAQGEPPKISFTRPLPEEENPVNFARRPPAEPRVRMQSPDPPGATAGWSGNAGSTGGQTTRGTRQPRDRILNFTLTGTAAHPENWQRLPVEPYASMLPAQQPSVVRSQYTPASGKTFPRMASRLPWLGGREETPSPAPPTVSTGNPYGAPTTTANGYPASGVAPNANYANGAGASLPPAGNAAPSAPSPLTTPTGATLNPAATSVAPPSAAWGQPVGAQPVAAPPGVAQPTAPYGNTAPPQYYDPQVSPAGTAPGAFDPNSPFFGGPPDPDPLRQLQLDISATEAPTGRFMVGVGINSEAGLFGSVVIDEQNFDLLNFPSGWNDVRNFTAFRGNGQRLRLEAAPGTEVQRYTVTFQEPYLLDTPVSTGVSGYYFSRAYYEWFEDRVGGRVALGYQFTPDLTGSLAYRGGRVNITDIIDARIWELEEVKQANAVHGFQASLAYDTRDNMFLATEGGLIQASFEEVVGTWQYPRAELAVSRHFTMHQRPDTSGRHVLSLSSRVGYTGPNTPIYEHFYIGGFSTLRGFQFRDASPVSSINPNVYIGGEFMLLASVEYMFPITADDMLRAVVFCDTGTVEPTIDNWTDRYRVAPGFGLRITVPAMGPAPIALDFAFPVSKNPTDRDEIFSFFIGFGRF